MPFESALGCGGPNRASWADTLSKMGFEALMGETFDNVFAIERPETITTFEHLASQTSTRAHLKLRKSPRIEFRAAVVPSGDETIVTLSFGRNPHGGGKIWLEQV